MPSVLITGANRGLGLEFARQYLASDWIVHACCRDPDLFPPKLSEKYSNLILHMMDVVDDDQLKKVSSEITGVPLDLLINNAGIADGYGHGVYELKDDPDIRNYNFAFWDKMMKTNVVAPARVISTFLTNIEASHKKIIVNISSGLGSITNLKLAGKYGYCSSKAALNMVSRGLAEWLSARDIIVISLSPGWTQTDMGGENATNSVEVSVTGMRTVIDSLTIKDSGRFWNFDGEELEW